MNKFSDSILLELHSAFGVQQDDALDGPFDLNCQHDPILYDSCSLFKEFLVFVNVFAIFKQVRVHLDDPFDQLDIVPAHC